MTRAQATQYRSGSRAVKSQVLDAVCTVTGFNPDYARRASRPALRPRVVRARPPRPAKYGPTVVGGVTEVLGVVNAPAGKRLAPPLPELVLHLRDQQSRSAPAMFIRAAKRQRSYDDISFATNHSYGTLPTPLPYLLLRVMSSRYGQRSKRGQDPCGDPGDPARSTTNPPSSPRDVIR